MIDTHFMSAQEKERVVKQFEIFLKSGLDRKHFTKPLYEHLHLHCSFIAHYNIDGFYATYFSGNKSEFKDFCNHFLKQNDWYNDKTEGFVAYNTGDYNMEDVNVAMGNVLIKYYDELVRDTTEQTRIFAINKIRILMADNDLSVEDIQ